MSDAVRMIDLAPLSRSLNELKGADPERQTLSDRMAARAALKHLERVHEDVGAAEGSTETKIDEPFERDRKRRQRPKQQTAPPSDERRVEPIPEREEGRLLDIKA